MKKFITTSENPVFKKDLIICDTGKLTADHASYNHITNKVEMNGYQIEVWLKDGWIKEVEGKEYTKFDMYDCLRFYDKNQLNKSCATYAYAFNNWLKQR